MRVQSTDIGPRQRSRLMSEQITIDTSSFSKFARDLRKVQPALAKQLRKELKVAGEIVATQARVNASFSTRIPRTIKVRAAGSTIKVVAGESLAENARRIGAKSKSLAHRAYMNSSHIGEAVALENDGKPGTFRHPVFGNRDKWVSQQARPFLHPAVLTHRKAAVDAAERALRTAFREAGLH